MWRVWVVFDNAWAQRFSDIRWTRTAFYRVIESPDDRSPKAIAYHWASRIMAVSLEMVIPGVIGYWVDGRLGTRVVFTLVGFGLGLTMGMMHLLKMTAPPKK